MGGGVPSDFFSKTVKATAIKLGTLTNYRPISIN